MLGVQLACVRSSLTDYVKLLSYISPMHMEHLDSNYRDHPQSTFVRKSLCRCKKSVKTYHIRFQ